MGSEEKAGGNELFSAAGFPERWRSTLNGDSLNQDLAGQLEKREREDRYCRGE